MKDYLHDIITYAHGLGVIDLVKINGTDTETEVTSYYSDGQTVVIVNGMFKTPMTEFKGTFGMPNLSKLKTILSFDDYDNESKIDLIREDRDGEQDVPVRIHFETANKDFINDYRLMSKSLINDKLKKAVFTGATWNVEFEPTVSAIGRLKKQAQANSEELVFNTRTENGDLKIYFGDFSSHSGNFVFHSGVTGTLSRAWNWPVKFFLAIMDMPGNKIIRLADAGAAEIVVDSGLATWTYYLPAQAK